MTVVATLSAVLTAALPVIAGVALGKELHVSSAAGIVLALPAIALVSWQRNADDRHAARTSPIYGMLAGVGFALRFIVLDRAGLAGAHPTARLSRPAPHETAGDRDGGAHDRGGRAERDRQPLVLAATGQASWRTSQC